MYDLIILGGGPAGLTAAVYALRKRLNALLITRDLGGKTNYRLQVPDVDQHLIINGEEVVNHFVNEISYLDFARKMEKVERLERVAGGYVAATRQGEYAGRAVIVATGARARRLDVPGEREFTMRGLCYSAVSYAPLFIGRDTAVIGDGGLALRAAAELAQIARYVTLLAPGHGDLDSPLGQRLQGLPNVLIVENCQVLRVNGDNFARSLTVKPAGQAPREIHAEAFFVELGLTPNSQLLEGLAELDSLGRVKVDSRNRTSAPGIFAAGDVTDAYAEQVLIAIGEGAKAGLSAFEYLLEQAAEEPAGATEWR
jgi:thioredoxin reductase